MASNTIFSYQRLQNNGGYEEEEERAVGKTRRRWSRIRKFGFKSKPKVRIPGLRKFLMRKNRLLSDVKVSWDKVLKRFKENRSHLGDIFAGNYLFLQVSPTSFKCVDSSFVGGQGHGLPSKHSLARIA